MSALPYPTVSVVVPCYCYGRYLDDCVSSILRQDGVNVRVLIIDDASQDDSFQVAERLVDRDPRVQAWRHKTNRGHIATYNEGLLGWADGEYCVLISADDILVEGALARAVGVMERNPNVGLVYGHAINWIDDKPLPQARQKVTGVRLWKGDHWIRTVCKLGHNLITSPEVVVRTRIQREVGGYKHNLPHSGDLEMWLRIATRSDVAFIEGADQAFYRIHSTNMTIARSPIVDLVQRSEAFESFFMSCGEALPDAPQLSRLARRSMAKEALWRAQRAYEKRQLTQTPVAQLKQFALDALPNAKTLLEYWGLRWCEFLGPRLAPNLQVFALAGVHRRARRVLWNRRWQRKGY